MTAGKQRDRATRCKFLSLLVGSALSSPMGVARADEQAVVIDRCHPQSATATSFKLNGEHMQIRFDGATPTLSYQIQSTSDLHTWTTVATMNANSFGSLFYVDPDVANQSARFYRSVAPVPTDCPAPVPPAPPAPPDPATQAMLDQVSVLWQPELDRLHAAVSEAQFVALISTLKQTPLETSITTLLTGKPEGENLRQLMLSINRVPFSSGAAAHVQSLVSAPSTGLGSTTSNLSSAMSTLQSAISASTDPDGVQRSFLVDLMVAIPTAKVRIKAYAASQLSNDAPGASTSLTAAGKSLFRTELFRGYMLSDPDLASDLLPFANRILAALPNPQDKAPILRELTVRHPGLLTDYLSSKPAVSVARPSQP